VSRSRPLSKKTREASTMSASRAATGVEAGGEGEEGGGVMRGGDDGDEARWPSPLAPFALAGKGVEEGDRGRAPSDGFIEAPGRREPASHGVERAGV
jgi:hypothetical protein